MNMIIEKTGLENYKLIASHKQKYEGHLKTYYLYEKR